jgi:cyclopropane fatty-acyl-phospholipid synthase-like methyltransferase
VRLKAWLPKDKSAICLDLGCGPGNVLYLLQFQGYRNIMGVDVSAEQLERAKRVCPNVECIDAYEYVKRFQAHYDLITAFDLIEHFHKDELLPLLDAMREALKPGGILILQTPNAESPWGLKLRYGDFTHEIAFDPRNLQHILSVTGFTAFDSRECGPSMHGFASLIRFMMWKGIWAGLALWNMAETGSLGSGIYTRVFIAKAERPLK